MIRQEFQKRRLQSVSHLVQFNTLIIIDIQILLLGNSKHTVIMQELYITHKLFGLELAHEVLLFPIKKSYMSLSRPN